jgi:hemerythrin
MNKISWTDKFSVGYESLDNQHMKIIQLINTLIDHRDMPINSEVMEDIIGELLKYSSQHLEYEENLLQSLEYPEYQEHKKLHAEYVETIAGYTIEAINTKVIKTPVFLNFLKYWWAEHILKEDMKFKPFLIAIQKHNVR